MTTRTQSPRRSRQSGSSIVEFTLVGIGVIFLLISIFEISRGMWIYHTLAHASKEATRFLIVHGTECQARGTCASEATWSTLYSRVAYHGVGLLPGQLDIQVYANNIQLKGSGNDYVKLSTLSGDTAVWSASAERGQAIQVGLRYPFSSALAMLWPGGGKAVNFTLVTLGAQSWDTMQF